MGTAVSCEQFRDDVAAAKLSAARETKGAKDPHGRLDVFQRRSKHIANLNRMVTTEYVPEFDMQLAKL